MGLSAFGAEREDFEGLGGRAQVTAYLEGDDVTAVLTYRDIPLADIGVTQLSSDPVSVTNGRFEPVKMETVMFDAETPDPTNPAAPITTTSATVTGDFSGEGAFGGAGAAGVAGYVGGPIHIEYGRGLQRIGTLQSVFFGTRDDN